MTVQEILEEKGNDIWMIPPEAKVIDALRLMADKGIGALIVSSQKRLKAIQGIISERDYARKVILQGKSSLDTPIQEIMTPRVYYVHPETTEQECMALMTKNRIRHLPVIHNDRLVGLVSIGDILKSVISQQKITIDHLQDYIIGKYL
ncbi:MAG: hypothetical protein A2Y56_01045 [Candidatus Aminicenantes bacterium RBG_13_63_10]|nr:MAG: hypothetical protein A2Y56_01045 [Candidatus Aminicenantes bacterium RBG_13_63_10]